MIVFGPKRKPPRRAAQSGSSNPSPPPSTTSTPPSLPQSRPLRRAPSDPPPYTLYPPERNPPRTLAPTPTTPPRQNGPPSRVAIDSSQATGDGPKQWQPRVPDALRHRISLCDLISSKLDAVITSIDGEVFSGDERELGTWYLKAISYPDVIDWKYSYLRRAVARDSRRWFHKQRGIQQSHYFSYHQHELFYQGQSIRQL